MNGHDMTVRKRLFDMEIDEISLVDRGANQHAAIVISKADGFEEDRMPQEIDVLYDSDGDLVDYDLEHGDVVYDEMGNEFVFIEEDDDDYDDYGKSEDYISKFRGAGLKYGAQDLLGRARGQGPVGQALKRGHEAGRYGVKWSPGAAAAVGEGMGTLSRGQERGMRAGMHLGRNQGKYAAGAGATALAGAGGAGGYAYNKKRKKNQGALEPTSKSLGDVVLEELSKAASEDERSEIIAKAMEEVEFAKEAAHEAWDRVAMQEDAMLENAFISKASEYNLPVDPVDFGQILKAASTVLDYEQLDLLDQLFSSVGEALYEEIGYVGDTDNASVLDVVNSYVGDIIGKADATPEMIQSAVFEANPDAYDAYLAENRW